MGFVLPHFSPNVRLKIISVLYIYSMGVFMKIHDSWFVSDRNRIMASQIMDRQYSPWNICAVCLWFVTLALYGHPVWFMWLNTLRPRQNGHHFADDTFKRISLNENVRISIKISLKFVPKGPINNNPALVQIMAWRRSGDKPLSESMRISLVTHICVTRPQWVKDSYSCGLMTHITLGMHCMWLNDSYYYRDALYVA